MVRKAFYIIFAMMVVVVVIEVVPKIAPPTAAEQRSADLVAANNQHFNNARARVLVQLKDPDSAKFMNMFVTDSGIVCGKVNAKNSFGAYDGPQAFIADRGVVYFDRGDRSPDFWPYWNQRCGKHGYFE